MNRSIISLAASVAFAAASMPAAPPAMAQEAAVVAPGDADDLLGPDDDVVVREYVVRRAPPPVVYEESIQLRPGSTVPDQVELYPMADVGQGRFKRVSYFVAPGNKIVVVDPGTRKVVRILDR